MIIGTEEEVNVAEDNDSWHGVGLSQPQAGEGRSAVVLAEGYPEALWGVGVRPATHRRSSVRGHLVGR